jgi:hypothetical protein
MPITTSNTEVIALGLALIVLCFLGAIICFEKYMQAYEIDEQEQDIICPKEWHEHI